MNKNITFGYSTTIKERHYLLKKVLPDDHSLHYLNKWRERRSLLSDEDFNLSLDQQGLSKLAFNRGVTPLNETNLDILFDYVTQQPWYQLHQTLFDDEIGYSYSSNTALRFHLNYFSKHLNQLVDSHSTIALTESAISSIVEGLQNDLLLLAEKTLIWDVHDVIERESILADTPELAFQQYINQRLSCVENTQQFFSEYPTLAKLLCIRLQFAIDNMTIFITSLVQESKQIQTVFNTSYPFTISEIEPGKGDSHNRGKSVMRFKLNKLILIYKYKNLQIGEQFNKFLSYIEGLDTQYTFYKVKRAIGSNFTIEEEVTQSTCHSESEIESYYFNYGSLLAITHWLGASDLHMENLIAHKEFPVLIDVETIIATDRTKQNEALQTKQQIIEEKSMINSGLLPLKRYWKRQLEMSALNGTKQKLPFKVRKLVNKNTSEVKLELDDEYIEGANNIPLLNNLEVNYQDYTDNIETGFVEMNDLLLEHKQDVLKTVQRLFSNCTVRHLLRDTQDYANFLSFAHHPSCMVDFIEREKIMENLWEAQFITKKVIPLEIEEMLNNDIPLFETNSIVHWIQNNSEQLKGHLKSSSTELLFDRITGMSKDTVFDSLLFLRESLGTLTHKLEEISVPSTNQDINDIHLQKAADIGDLVINNLRIDHQNEFIYWAESNLNEDGEITLNYPSTNLYNGTVGLFIFLLHLNYFVPKKRYKSILIILEKEIFNDTLAKEEYFSAFYGDGANLTASFYAYRLTKNEKYLKKLNFYIEKLIKKEISTKIDLDEWIYGKSSLLVILVSIYQIVPLPKIRLLIKKIAKKMPSTILNDISFAHGQAGIIYSLHQANKILSDLDNAKKIDLMVSKLTQSLISNKNLNNSWCKGAAGINHTLSALNKKTLNADNGKGTDSTICHGNYLVLHKNYLFKIGHELSANGLFNGLPGVGYFQLFNYHPKLINNILYLE